MNFCRGSYHNNNTRPDGTAPQRNVLSVYGFLAEGKQKSPPLICDRAETTEQRASVTPHLPTLHLLQPLVSGSFTDTANFLLRERK